MSRAHRGAAAGALVALGLAFGTTGSAAAADLVTNGSFEQPDIPAGTFAIFASVPGWTHQAAPGATSSGIEIQDHVSGAPAPGAGGQFAELDSNGPGRISQTIATTPGVLYRLTYSYSPRPGTAAADNHFWVEAGPAGAEVGPLASAGQTDWRTSTLDFVADASQTVIAFEDLGPEQASGGVGAYLDSVSVEQVNRAPDCSAVAPDTASLWAPNRTFHTVTLSGATDPDGDTLTTTVTEVTQDEPVGDAPDAAAGASPEQVQLRAERRGDGDGRVYRIAYTAADSSGGACTGVVTVGVAHDQSGGGAVDSGGAFDSFG